MPRLLNVNNYHYRRGGAETVYLGHGALFAEAGWDIDWLAMRHPETLPDAPIADFADLIDLEHMAGPLAKVRAAGAIVWNRDARARTAAIVARARPDVAHLHNIYHHLSPSVLVELKRHGVPTVLTAHDLKLACPAYKMLSHGTVCEACKGGRVWNVARRRCLKGSLAISGVVMVESALHRGLGLWRRHIDRVVVPSAFYRAKLIEWGWDPAQLVHIHNFVETDGPAPATAQGAGPILYFGRLSDEKGLATLIHAALAARVPVRIAGTGPAEADLRALVARIGAPVAFMGHRTGADLADLLRDARATVLPSEWYENAPMSVMEAFLARRPVIGAAIGGIPELVVDGVTGWTFAAGDTAALAARLGEAYAASAATRAALGTAGLERMQRDFGRGRYREAMTALYATLT